MKNHRDYNREWMKRDRAKKRWQQSIDKGKCPVCTMLLKSTYHIRCPYLDTLENPQDICTNDDNPIT